MSEPITLPVHDPPSPYVLDGSPRCRHCNQPLVQHDATTLYGISGYVCPAAPDTYITVLARSS